MLNISNTYRFHAACTQMPEQTSYPKLKGATSFSRVAFTLQGCSPCCRLRAYGPFSLYMVLALAPPECMSLRRSNLGIPQIRMGQYGRGGICLKSTPQVVPSPSWGLPVARPSPRSAARKKRADPSCHGNGWTGHCILHKVNPLGSEESIPALTLTAARSLKGFLRMQPRASLKDRLYNYHVEDPFVKNSCFWM